MSEDSRLEVLGGVWGKLDKVSSTYSSVAGTTYTLSYRRRASRAGEHVISLCACIPLVM